MTNELETFEKRYELKFDVTESNIAYLAEVELAQALGVALPTSRIVATRSSANRSCQIRVVRNPDAEFSSPSIRSRVLVVIQGDDWESVFGQLDDLELPERSALQAFLFTPEDLDWDNPECLRIHQYIFTVGLPEWMGMWVR